MKTLALGFVLLTACGSPDPTVVQGATPVTGTPAAPAGDPAVPAAPAAPATCTSPQPDIDANEVRVTRIQMQGTDQTEGPWSIVLRSATERSEASCLIADCRPEDLVINIPEAELTTQGTVALGIARADASFLFPTLSLTGVVTCDPVEQQIVEPTTGTVVWFRAQPL